MSYPGQYGSSYGRGYPPGQPPPSYASQPQPGYPGQQPPGAFASQPAAPAAYASAQPNPAAYASAQPGYPPAGYPGYQQPGFAPPGAFSAPAARPAWAQGYYNQLTPQELSNLQAWFTSVDRDRSGHITAQELANANFNGFRFSLETAALLVKVFDVDRNGTIGFYEYASLHKFIISMQNVFHHFDRDRSQSLELHELDAALRQGGFSFSPPVIHAIGSRFAQGQRGLNMEQFVRMSAFLGRIRSNFERRDPQRRGYISLSFEDLVLLIVD